VEAMIKDSNVGNKKKRDNTAARIVQAISKSNGLLTLAASKAGVSYRTIERYVHDYPSVATAVCEAKETMLDYVEGKLFTQIRDGNTVAILFYLKTQGKARGYIERQEFANAGGESFRVEHDAKSKLLDELNRYASRAKETAGDQATD